MLFSHFKSFILKKIAISLYTYISILYVVFAFSFRAVIIFGVNKFNQALSGNSRHYLNIYHYVGMVSVYFISLILVRFFDVSGNNVLVVTALSLLSVVMLDIAMKSWSYVDSLWLSYRYDYEEDYKIAINILCLSLIMVPLFIGVMLTTLATHTILVYLFLISRLRYLDEFEMTAHDCMHKPILKVEADDTALTASVIKLIYWSFNYGVGVLFLYPPHFYYYHHMYNHHRENCGPKDVTSPLSYDRQSISGFCRAALKFTLGWTIGADLFIYLLMQKKWRIARNLILSQGYFYSILYFISLYSPFFALCLLLQHIVDGFMLTITIWRWHGFIDPTDPQNSFKNTTNIIFDSRYTYAYHTLHHERPGMHYANVDDYLKKHKDRIVNSRMILLRNMGTMELVSLILTAKPDIIAHYFVNLGDQPLSLQEITEVLRLRLQPSATSPAMPCYFQKAIDSQLKKWMLRYNREVHRLMDRHIISEEKA